MPVDTSEAMLPDHTPYDADRAMDDMRRLVNATGHIGWKASPEGHLTEHLAWRAFTGQSIAQVARWGWLEAIHPDDRGPVREAWTAARAHSVAFDLVYQLRRHDGRYRHVAHSAVAIHEADGTLREWVGVCIDRTEDILAIQAAQASEERLRFLAEQAVDAILIADAEWRYVEVNPSACELLGYTRDELLQMRIVDVVQPEEKERLADLEAALQRGEVHRGEWWLVRKDTTLVPVEITSRLLADGRCQAIARDMTERKRLEAELQASAERYQTIVETANEGIWLVDAQGCTLYANDRMAGMLGYCAADMAGKPITNFCLPEDAVSVAEHIHHNLHGSFEQFESRFRHRDGHLI